MLTLAGNLILGGVKCVAAILSGSVALSVDGLYSLSDGIGAVFVFGCLSISGKPPDASHPFGHGKTEFLASLIVYSLLAGAGLAFAIGGVSIMIMGRERTPSGVAFFAALLSIAANYLLLKFNLCAGREVNSPALIANGHDNVADLCASIIVALGVIASQMGYLFADALAGVLVSIFVLANACREWRRSFANLLDRAAPPATLRKIRSEAATVAGVEGIGPIRTRLVGRNLWVDLDVLVSPGCTVKNAGEIAGEVRGHLLRKAKHVEDVVVYYHANNALEHANSGKLRRA
jgi:cation diffusion facilitator family transporter